MQEENHGPDNPYTQLEGYTVRDDSGEEIGKVEGTVYDAPSDVLKYIVVRRRPIPAEQVEVHVEAQSVSVPYDAATVESAPKLHELSGAYDRAVHEHYGGRG